MKAFNQYVLAVAAIITRSYAQSCSSTLQPTHSIKPVAASGYTWNLVATGLTAPRTLGFGSDGGLYALEAGSGVTKLTVAESAAGCVSLTNQTTIISDPALTHGMLILDSRLIVSSASIAYQVALVESLDSVVLGSNVTLVNGMAGIGTQTCTLRIAANSTNALIISHGSGSNLDPAAASPDSGIAMVKMFHVDGTSGCPPLNFTADGTLLGWGLRNDIGIAQHPLSHGLWAVENGADNLVRDGVNIVENNPAEKLNYLGVINPAAATPFAAKDFEYPTCFAAWNPSALPDNQNITVGAQFALNSIDDASCQSLQAPRISMQAHMAPIDIEFQNATTAWISFHGSTDRAVPGEYRSALV